MQFIRTLSRSRINTEKVRGRKEGTKKKGIRANLGVESSEQGSVPWVWFQTIIQSVAKAIGSTSENFIYNKGTLPFGLELVLFLLG